MDLNCVGVLEDGSNRSPAIPSSVRVPLRFVLGSSVTFRLTAFRAVGAILMFDPTDQLFLTIRQGAPPVSNPITVSKAGALVPTEGPNRADFTLTPTDQRAMAPGLWAYEVTLLRTGGLRDVLIPLSRLILDPNLRVL